MTTPFRYLAEFVRPGVRLGVDAVQYDFYKQLVKNFPDLQVADLQKEILDIRVVKSEEEIARIKDAFALTEKIMAQFRGCCKSR